MAWFQIATIGGVSEHTMLEDIVGPDDEDEDEDEDGESYCCSSRSAGGVAYG